MANKYYTLVTDIGRAKMANAQVIGGKVSFSKIALGSAKTKPNETMTELGKEEWRGNISSVSIAEDNPQWIVIESVVPATVGGFTINEVGLYDDEGDLIVIGNYPETYKPKGDEGTIKDLAIRLIIEVTNAENVDIKVDPSVVIATRKYVDEAITIAMEGIDFSEIEGQLKTHADKVATKDELGHVKVGRGLAIDKDGKLSVPSAPTIYGVEIDETNPDPYGAVKYIADSEGFEPLYSGDGTVDYGSWGDKFPINKVKVVLLKDGEVVEELDKNDYTKTVDGRTVDITSGDAGDVMVGIPLTYWKFERVGNKLRIYVTEHEIDGFVAYAHSRDGVVQDDYLYVGAFKGTVKDGKLRSLHDTMSTGRTTIGKFREYAENNGAGYGQMNWATMTLLQIYSVLLSKNLNSQDAFGMGYTNGNDDFIINGATVGKGLFYGEQTGKKQMKFVGLEDFYGNRYEWVDGIASSEDNKLLVNQSNVGFNDLGVGYNVHGTLYRSGYLKKVEGTNDLGFIPLSSGGSTSTYYSDYCYSDSSGGQVAYFGGLRSDYVGGADAGAFQLEVNYSPSFSISNLGARCLFLKEK